MQKIFAPPPPPPPQTPPIEHGVWTRHRQLFLLITTLHGIDAFQFPIDPNPAISAHVVFPQSGHIRPEKRPFFQKKSIFFQNRTLQKVLTAYRDATYQIKAHEMSFQTQKKSFCCDRYVCVGKTWNLDTCSKFWGHFVGIWGNPGEIPHTGWNFSGV